MDHEQCQDECEYYRHKTTELEQNLEQEKKLRQETDAQKQVHFHFRFHLLTDNEISVIHSLSFYFWKYLNIFNHKISKQ